MNIIRTKTGNNHKQQACSNPCYITKTAKTNWKLSQQNKVLRWIIVSSETAESSETKSWIICCNFFSCFHPSFTFFPLPKPVSRLTRIYHHLINPLTVRVTGAPQMILPPVSSINPCSPMPPGTWRTPGLSIPWCCLSTSSSVCLVFFPFHCALQNGLGQTWWTGDMTIPLQFASLNDRQEVFRWSNCLLDLGMDFLVGNMVFVWDV